MTKDEQVKLLKKTVEYLYNAISEYGSYGDYLDTMAYMPLSCEQAKELGMDYMAHDLKSERG